MALVISDPSSATIARENILWPSDLENTTYSFTLEDGSTVEFKGNEEVEYDGETHTAANLFDALKEGYYGKFWFYKWIPQKTARD